MCYHFIECTASSKVINALKRSPGIIRKSKVSYPVPGFLTSATWPSLPKKHYNGLNQTIPKQSHMLFAKIKLFTDDVFNHQIQLNI